MDDVYVSRSRLSSLKDASSAATKLLPSSSLRYSSEASIESISPARHPFFLRANGEIQILDRAHSLGAQASQLRSSMIGQGEPPKGRLQPVRKLRTGGLLPPQNTDTSIEHCPRFLRSM
jgi:hypothetical protein